MEMEFYQCGNSAQFVKVRIMVHFNYCKNLNFSCFFFYEEGQRFLKEMCFYVLIFVFSGLGILIGLSVIVWSIYSQLFTTLPLLYTFLSIQSSGKTYLILNYVKIWSFINFLLLLNIINILSINYSCLCVFLCVSACS